MNQEDQVTTTLKPYRIEDGKIIKRGSDIAIDDDTIEMIAYLQWLSQGNTPEGLDDIV